MTIRKYSEPSDKSGNNGSSREASIAIRQYYKSSSDFDIEWIWFDSINSMKDAIESSGMDFAKKALPSLSKKSATRIVSGDIIKACTITMNDKYSKSGEEYEFSAFDKKHLIAIFRQSFVEKSLDSDNKSPSL